MHQPAGFPPILCVGDLLRQRVVQPVAEAPAPNRALLVALAWASVAHGQQRPWM